MSVNNNQVLRLVATWDMPGGTIAQNVFHVLTNFASAQTEEDVLQQSLIWVETMYVDLIDVMADSVSLNNVEVSHLQSTDPAVWVSLGQEAGILVGTVAEDAIPNGVALVIRAGIAITSKLARKYIPGLAETSSGEDTWGAGALAAALVFLTNWLEGHAFTGPSILIPGIFSVATEAFEALAEVGAIASVPGYQRRRKPGVGD